MSSLGPRVVIAGTRSGSGKTTVATGLMAALAARGLRVAAAKVGPDFIDPGYHAAATGRRGRNLDAWISGPAAIPRLAARAGDAADVLVIEGVMGLFDGAADAVTRDDASTAHIARVLDAPVVLVVDASAMSGSVAAEVHGFATFDPDVRIAGVILNRVGSESHDTMLRRALAATGVPVLGSIRRDDSLEWRDRHLGLVPVVEHPSEVMRSIGLLADVVVRSCDLNGVVALARSAPPLAVESLPAPDSATGTRVRVAVAGGPAFSFCYPDNLEAFEAAGAELVPFDPTSDAALPQAVDGLYAGGGFPEVFVDRLADNQPLLEDVRRRVGEGLVTWAECGGLLWLARSLDGRPLCGAIAADAVMTDRLTLGYRRATPMVENPVVPAGHELRGHEFHYSKLDPPGAALSLAGRTGTERAGYASPTLLATYLPVHLGADPAPARRFIAAAARPRTEPTAAR
jgi:cobyrinic acid a,c-diamide synthase